MDQHPGDPDAGDAADAMLTAAAEELREVARHESAAQAGKLRRIARLAELAEAAARRQLAAGPRVSGQPDDTQVIHAAVIGEVAAVLGISDWTAGALIELAMRLTRVLTDTLDALEHGRLDHARARAMSEATSVCTDAVARKVEATMLGVAGDAPWDGLSPRNWRARLDRAVIKADPHAARARREAARAERELRTWPDRDGTGILQMRAGIEDIAVAEQVVAGLAHAWPTHDQHGGKLTMDQRRVDATMDLLRRVLDGALLPHLPHLSDLPHLPARRDREVGIVLPADTLFGDGPAADDPGELRCLSSPAPLDPVTAREIAEAEIASGARVCVYLTDTRGKLQRLVRLMLTTPHGWTRDTLTAAVRAALPDLPALHTDRYTPTVAITEHVHARNPRCTCYNCARVAARADLDHDQPWPRGPTDADNLHPRCRRHHQLKTRGLLDTSLQPDGTLHTRMLTGLTITTRPEALPGHAPGEGYGPTSCPA